jgi:HTH-type transcriptional regulator/antitoxin HigA
MNMKPIRTAKNHKDALAEISKLMASDPDIGTPKGDRLNVLVTLVQAFEVKHFPMPLPDPIEAIKQVPHSAARPEAQRLGANDRQK